MIYSLSLVLLLSFELSFYLLIVQTGIAQHYNSDLIVMLPMFLGGVVGTILSGQPWGKITNPVHKIIIALSLQLIMSFLYPNYNPITLALLGLSVGMMAPLGIYLFKEEQKVELLLALGIAYILGTYNFNSLADQRTYMAITFTMISLISALLLINYKHDKDKPTLNNSISSYLPLMLWILLDSNLFKILSRHDWINIWSTYTKIIILFHILGLLSAYVLKIDKKTQHIFIALLFVVSYALAYLELPLALAVAYPFTISYYNVIVFITLTKERSLNKLSYLMVFIGWIASGLGLAIALSKISY